VRERRREVGVAQDRVGAAVPDRHRAGAVGALRDAAGEVLVLEGVVLGRHGEPLVLRVVGEAARHRPRAQHALGLEAQVVVEVAGLVPVNDEHPRALRGGWDRRRRLRRAGEIALPAVVVEGIVHGRAARPGRDEWDSAIVPVAGALQFRERGLPMRLLVTALLALAAQLTAQAPAESGRPDPNRPVTRTGPPIAARRARALEGAPGELPMNQGPGNRGP